MTDGTDIWSTLVTGDASPHKAFFYFKQNQPEAVRSGPWTLRVAGKASPALYHLGRDIGEKYNVLSDRPDVSSRLLAVTST